MKEEIEKLLDRHKKIYTRKMKSSSPIENIIDEVAIDLGITRKIVIDVIAAQFMFLENMIKEVDRDTNKSFEEYKSVRFIYLGAFKPSRKKYEYDKKKK